MQPFETHRGVVAVLNRANVDTDQIIPKQFLKSIQRTGFGKSLFFDWRYGPEGQDNPSFELNRPEARGASILVVGNNFGCGSSREHAVWAVLQAGFKAVIAPRLKLDGQELPGFADIFRNNSVKNGLLTIELSADEVAEIRERVKAKPGLEATVDLEKQDVTLHGNASNSYSFQIEASVKEHLLRGLDDIALTLEHADDIAAFEQGHDPQITTAG